MVEVDVQRTADGTMVLLHDLTLERTTTGRGPVRASPYSTVAGLDAGAWFDARFRSARVPIVDDVLDLVADAGALICLEVKGADDREATDTAIALARHLETRRSLAWSLLASFHHRALDAASRVAPGLAIAPDLLPEDRVVDPDELVAQATALGAPVVQRRHDLLDAAVVGALHAADVAVWGWTANTHDEQLRLAELGADGVMADDVGPLVDALSRPMN